MIVRLILILGLLVPACMAQLPDRPAEEVRADVEFAEGGRVQKETAKLSFRQTWELTAASYRTAIERFTRARDLYRLSGNVEKEAVSLSRIGRLHDYLGHYAQAIELFQESAGLFQKLNKTSEAATAKAYVGTILLNQRQFTKAMSYFDEVLIVARSVRDFSLEENALSGLAECYAEGARDPKKAIEYWSLAAKAAEAAGNPLRHGENLRKLAATHGAQGERQIAIGYYVLAIRQLQKDRTSEGGLLEAYARQGLALQYAELGDYRKAIKFDLEAVQLLQDVGLRRLVADAFLIVSVSYSNLSEPAEAMKYCERALEIYQSLKNTHGEATAYAYTGRLYLFDFKEYAKAQQSFERSLELARELKDARLQAKALNGIGDVFYYQPGTRGKEIEYRLKAYEQYKAAKDVRGMADTHYELGLSYYSAGDRKQATVQLNTALITYSYLDRRSDRVKPLTWLASVWESAGNPEVAAMYAKFAVSEYQKFRNAIRGLDAASQRNYLKKVESDYRTLARLLLKQGRLREAHQALVALKDEQSLDYFKYEEKGHQINLALTGREAEFLQLYRDGLSEIDKHRERITELQRLQAEGKATPEQLAESKQASAKMGGLFQGLVDRIEAAASNFGKSDGKPEYLPTIAENTSMWNALAAVSSLTAQPTVAVYQLVSDKGIDSLIVSANDIKHVSVEATGLNPKARTYWALLQSDAYDPTAAGKELYDIVIRPLEKELPAGTKTILWSLDGNLRYVPMAALFDGKQYSVERFNHVILTRSDAARLTKPVSPQWAASGFGSSKAHTVQNLDKTTSFMGLPGVRAELRSLFEKSSRRSLLDGEVLLDQSFTRQNMLERLAQRRPVVHIASHFSFRPGDDRNSFLLLGDGTAFTLADMKAQKGLFNGVELLTLSACNTAAQHADATGYEVDAFFQLAQRLGAESVLATLWPVADNSTPWLMREFYDLKINRRQNKAEALRNSQLALLNGSAKTKPSVVRTNASSIQIIVADVHQSDVVARSERFVIATKDAKKWVRDPRRPFAHPFYWSPFVLIGNWQ